MTRSTAALCLAVLCAPTLVRGQEDREAPRVIVLQADSASQDLRLYAIGAQVDAILDAQHGIEVLEPEDRRSDARAVLRQLRDAIRTFVQPPFADGEEVQALGHEHLAVVGRAEQHAWIGRFLELQAQRADTIALIDVEMLKIAPAVFGTLGIGDVPRVLDAETAAALRREMTDADGLPIEGIDRLQSPRLGLLALQRAQVSSLEMVSYIKDFETVELEDGTRIADPVVDTVRAGVELDGCFALLGGAEIGLSWTVKVSDLLRPIPKFETRLGVDAPPVSIQLPNVAVATFEAQVVLSPGALSVFPGPELRGARVVLLMSIAGLESGGKRAPKGPTLELITPGDRKN